MTVAHFLKFLLGSAATALAFHVLIAVAAASALYGFYPHRVFNARTWSDEGTERFQLVGSFLAEQARASTRPMIVFAGSSVTYGYPWHERFVFSQLFADRQTGSRVINASLVAADVTGINDWIVCAASRNHLRFAVVVVEIPVVNTTAHLVRYRQNGQPSATGAGCGPGGTDPSYFRLATTRPRGIGWFGFLWNREARETLESSVQIVPVPKDYFASASDFESIRDEYVGRIKVLLTNAQQIADVVYAFPSPIYVGGLAEIGEDTNAIMGQLQSSVTACSSAPGVRCLDTSAFWMNRSYYYNLTHLNQAGHHAMATLLDALVDGRTGGAMR